MSVNSIKIFFENICPIFCMIKLIKCISLIIFLLLKPATKCYVINNAKVSKSFILKQKHDFIK